MTEDQIQIAFVKWLDEQDDIKYTMIPNELGVFKRCPGYFQIVNRFLHLGLRKGLPDMFLIVQETALFIEFKQPGKKASAHQIKWLEWLEKAGIENHICFSPEEAIDICEKLR